MSAGRGAARRSAGTVLVLVLVFALLLASSVATFLRRATVDLTIAHNRDAASRAEALARGGVRLAEALVLEDLVRELQGQLPLLETLHDPWARVEEELSVGDDAVLRLRIEDAGAHLNLNVLLAEGGALGGREVLLVELLDKVIAEMPGLPEEKNYDPLELARNLIDWVDEDTAGLGGGFEDDYYQSQEPPYRAPNRALLAVDEVRLVEGFDAPLVEALRPYVTVFPYAGGGGINPNTAPNWVLSVLYTGDSGEFRFVDKKTVSDILRIREAGGVLCPDERNDLGCTPIEGVIPETTSPELSFASDVFLVTAEAEVEGIRRTVEAVLDRTDPLAPQLLFWRVR